MIECGVRFPAPLPFVYGAQLHHSTIFKSINSGSFRRGHTGHSQVDACTSLFAESTT